MQSAADLLGADGPFAREIPGYAPRASQQAMAAAVEEAIAERQMLVAEAGTGTGKTFAYLVPALMSGKRVIVSTGTKTLQDQLFHRDLPQVRSVLGARLCAALLKGRANYLCLHRLDQAHQEGRFANREQTSQLQAIHVWAKRTLSGDRAELAEVAEDSPLWPRVTSTTENCLGADCPMFNDCFVVKARRAAQEADLVVVNHHLLFADLAIKREGFGEILPGAHAFILDEAHQIPELAGQFFSVTLSARQLNELAGDALAECANVSGALALLQPGIDALIAAVKRMRLALGIDQDLRDFHERFRFDPLIGRAVRRDGKPIDLQPREFQLLEFMMRHAGQSVTRTMLLEKVWNYHFDPQTNVIDVHVSRLRAKLDKGFNRPMLTTVRGAGYRLDG